MKCLQTGITICSLPVWQEKIALFYSIYCAQFENVNDCTLRESGICVRAVLNAFGLTLPQKHLKRGNSFHILLSSSLLHEWEDVTLSRQSLWESLVPCIFWHVSVVWWPNKLWSMFGMLILERVKKKAFRGEAAQAAKQMKYTEKSLGLIWQKCFYCSFLGFFLPLHSSTMIQFILIQK